MNQTERRIRIEQEVARRQSGAAGRYLYGDEQPHEDPRVRHYDNRTGMIRRDESTMARSNSGAANPVPQARQDLRQAQQTRQERSAAWVQQQVNEGYGIVASRAEQLAQTQAPQQNATNRPRQPRQA